MELSGQKKLNYNNNAGNVQDPQDSPGPGNFIVFYPSAGLVIVEVHKLAGRLQTSRDLIGFSLSDVDKVLSKSEVRGERGVINARERPGEILLVSVLNVVPTAAPDPGRLQVLRSPGATAATAGELAVSAAPGHAVDHPGARHGVGEGRLLRGWK